jgi:hypothetical protein
LLSRFHRLGLFLGGGFQARNGLFSSFQACSVIRLLFAGGGERCICAVQGGCTQSAVEFFTIGFECLDIVLQPACLIAQGDDFLFQTINGGEPSNSLSCVSGLGVKVCLFLQPGIECLPNLFFLLPIQDNDSCRFSLEQVQFFPLFALALMDTDGYQAVDLCARYLLQDRSSQFPSKQTINQ